MDGGPHSTLTEVIIHSLAVVHLGRWAVGSGQGIRRDSGLGSRSVGDLGGSGNLRSRHVDHILMAPGGL